MSMSGVRAVSLLLVLGAAGASAQPITPIPPVYEQCTNLATPGQTPPAGQQLLYCKAGSGYCAKDAAGVEKCTGTGAVGPPGPAGAAIVSVGTTPPATPVSGQLWWRPDRGSLYIYYHDGTSAQWVPAVGGGGPP